MIKSMQTVRAGLALIIVFIMFFAPMGLSMPIAEAGGPTTIKLIATASGNTINLNWNAPTSTSGLTGYFIYRSTTSGAQSNTPIRDFPVMQTSYTDTSLSNGTYYYIVKPVYNNSTPGAPSNEANATVGPEGNQSGVTIVFQVGSTTMLVNGTPQTINAPPEIVNGRTFVPLTALVVPLGGQVNYDPANKQVTIHLGATSIDLWIGNTSAQVNGQTKTMDVPPYVSNGRTMLPLGFVTQNLGCQVEWNGATLQVTIRYGTGSAVQTVLANYTGTWEMTRNGEPGHLLVLSQNGSVVTGYQGYDVQSGHPFCGTVSGNTLEGWFYPDQQDQKWRFNVTMSAVGQSFDGLEYYSDSPITVHGQKAGATPPTNTSPGTSSAVASFSGTWDCIQNGESGFKMVLTQSGSQVTGKWDDTGWLVKGTVNGNTLNGQFYLPGDSNSTTNFTITMAANGQSFNGTKYFSNPPWPLSGTKSST